MLDPGWLAFSSGGQALAIPVPSVVAVRTWCPPKALPRSAPWVEGVLAGEGEAVPVLREGYAWGERAGTAEIFVLIQWEGCPLALPGANPRVVSQRPQAPQGEDQEGPWSGTLDEGPGTIRCLDLGKLYMALGLH